MKARISTIVVLFSLLFNCVIGCSTVPVEFYPPVSEWNIISLAEVYWSGSINWSAEGEITSTVDIAVIFAFDDGPKATLMPELDGNVFATFDKSFSPRDRDVSVLFESSDSDREYLKIRRFTPKSRTFSEGWNIFHGGSFYMNTTFYHRSDFNFWVAITMSPRGSYLKDTNCFDDGAEHHIDGEVNMFGLNIRSEGIKPLVISLDGDRYTYVNGKGTVRAVDGHKIELGTIGTN